MNKILIFTILSLFLVSVLAYASQIVNEDIIAEVLESTEIQLEKMNLTDLNHSDLVCKGRHCTFALWKEKVIDRNGTIEKIPLGSNHRISFIKCVAYNEYNLTEEGNETEEGDECIEYGNYNRSELRVSKKNKIVSFLDTFAEVSKNREETNDGDHQLGGGRVTIT